MKDVGGNKKENKMRQDIAIEYFNCRRVTSIDVLSESIENVEMSSK